MHYLPLTQPLPPTELKGQKVNIFLEFKNLKLAVEEMGKGKQFAFSWKFLLLIRSVDEEVVYISHKVIRVRVKTR